MTERDEISDEDAGGNGKDTNKDTVIRKGGGSNKGNVACERGGGGGGNG